MKGRFTYYAIIILGIIAFSAVVYRKIGPERLTLWYYKYATKENITIAGVIFAVFVAIVLTAFLLFKRYQKKRRKRLEEEKKGIDLKDLFSESVHN